MIGNTLEEASDLLSAINFIPDGFGRYRLKRKLAVVDYIKPNEKYLERRKDASANILMGQASTFTNEIDLDKSLLINKRERISPQYIVKFNKSKDTWFTVWNNYIVSDYNKEQVRTIPMSRYLDDQFNQQNADMIQEIFDVRSFRFTTLATFKRFQKQLKLTSKKK